MSAVMPLNQAARREYMNALDAVERQEIPAPLHTSRDPWPDGLTAPRGVVTLKADAEAHGWDVRLTYAHGPHLGGRGVPVRHSIAARCWIGSNMYAIAFYVSADRRTWKFDGSMLRDIHGAVPMFPYANVTEFREFLAARGEVSPEFFQAIRERVESSKAKAKSAAASRPKKAKKVHA